MALHGSVLSTVGVGLSNCNCSLKTNKQNPVEIIPLSISKTRDLMAILREHTSRSVARNIIDAKCSCQALGTSKRQRSGISHFKESWSPQTAVCKCNGQRKELCHSKDELNTQRSQIRPPRGRKDATKRHSALACELISCPSMCSIPGPFFAALNLAKCQTERYF